MSNVAIVKMTLTSDKLFILENETMQKNDFIALIKELKRSFESVYRDKGSETYIYEIENQPVDAPLLGIAQQKVPNVVKALVEHPRYNIEVKICREVKRQTSTTIIRKPFNVNQCLAEIPYYNPKINEVSKVENATLNNSVKR